MILLVVGTRTTELKLSPIFIGWLINLYWTLNKIIHLSLCHGYLLVSLWEFYYISKLFFYNFPWNKLHTLFNMNFIKSWNSELFSLFKYNGLQSFFWYSHMILWLLYNPLMKNNLLRIIVLHFVFVKWFKLSWNKNI